MQNIWCIYLLKWACSLTLFIILCIWILSPEDLSVFCLPLGMCKMLCEDGDPWKASAIFEYLGNTVFSVCMQRTAVSTDGALGYWVTLLCENGSESAGGMQKQQSLVSESKTEEILSCQIRETVYGMS